MNGFNKKEADLDSIVKEGLGYDLTKRKLTPNVDIPLEFAVEGMNRFL